MIDTIHLKCKQVFLDLHSLISVNSSICRIVCGIPLTDVFILAGLVEEPVAFEVAVFS